MAASASAILTYHSLDGSGSPISIAPELFRRQLDELLARGWKIVPLREIRESPGAVALTFDDGYRSFLDRAQPILQSYGVTATVFVVTAYVGGRNEWVSPGLPRLDLMDWSEIREVVQAGHEIGSHTVSHRNLADLDPAEAGRELTESRQAIEDSTGQPVTSLAFPFGAESPSVRAMAMRSFRLACGVEARLLGPDDDPFALPRIDAAYLRRPFWVSNLHNVLGRAYLAAQWWDRRFR